MEQQEKVQFKLPIELQLISYQKFVNNHLTWACDGCLKSKKALLARPSFQTHSPIGEPHYAYFDSRFTCRTCKEKFVFSKEEKQYWYEKLQFWVFSTPVNCASCRKEIRELKAENTTLSDLLRKQEGDLTQEELETVRGIYEKWGKEDKVNYYTAVLRKRK